VLQKQVREKTSLIVKEPDLTISFWFYAIIKTGEKKLFVKIQVST